MFDFSAWDIIKIIVLLPFLLIFKIFKSIRPKAIVRDNKLINNLYDIMDEAQHFALMINKGPTKLEKYWMDSSPLNVEIEFHYLSEKFEQKNVISFNIKRSENKISLRRGGTSAGGIRYFDKKNIDYENIAKEVYKTIELAYIAHSFNEPRSTYIIDTLKWKKEIIQQIPLKYGINDINYAIRRALIMSSHDENHYRYLKAKKDLLNFVSEDKVNLFVDEIKQNYISKSVMDKLTKG